MPEPRAQRVPPLSPAIGGNGACGRATKNTVLFYCYCLLIFTSAENQHNYFWRDYRGTIPSDALEVEGLYVAQIPYNGALPATLYPEKKEAVSECEGHRVVVKEGIKLLCDAWNTSFSWEFVNVNKLTKQKLKDYVIGGTEDGSTLYIGKIFHEGEWKIGKVFPPSSRWKGLRVWYNNGDKYVTDDFQILKYTTQLAHIFSVRTFEK
ncbi:hypothetical protein Trydic_g19807 [Trypoxylus dichotomus]